jgi:hypothetical protein
MEQASAHRVPAIPRTYRGAGGDGPQRRLCPSLWVSACDPRLSLGVRLPLQS